MSEPTGVVLAWDDSVIEAPTGMPWPAWLANVAEHCVRAQIGDWPGGEERYWPTGKAMEEEP